MNLEKIFDGLLFELSETAIALIIFIVVRTITDGIIRKQARKHDLDSARTLYTRKFFDVIWMLLLLVAMGFIWNFSFKETFASFFAVAGVALFASWSILSNITASVLLFFNFPFKIGSRIKIMDKDDSVVGIVKDITFFSIQIESDEGDLISYPNNVAIQKGIVQLKENKRG
jgi:MscS family membrane protein